VSGGDLKLLLVLLSNIHRHQTYAHTIIPSTNQLDHLYGLERTDTPASANLNVKTSRLQPTQIILQSIGTADFTPIVSTHSTLCD
jgi:hypothetical protein